MHFIQRYLRPGDNFIDIGSNIGQYSLLASSVVGSSGSVSAFEPVPQTLDRLKENIDRNHLTQVTIFPMALGEKSEFIEFTIVGDAVSHISSPDELLQDSRDSKIKVLCCCLDDVLQNRPYAMAKIDVEGGELSVLKGAQRLLSQSNPPVLMLEINGAFKRYGLTKQDIVQHLDQLGYSSALYNADANELTFTDEIWGDVLFISRNHTTQVLERIQTANSAC